MTVPLTKVGLTHPRSAFAQLSAAISQLRKRRVTSELMWVILGFAAGAAAQLVSTRLLTQFISRELFGTVSLLLGLMTLGKSVFCNPWMSAQTRFYGEYAARDQLPTLRRSVGRLMTGMTALLVGAMLVGGAIYSRFHNISVAAFIALAILTAIDSVRTFEVNPLVVARRQMALTLILVLEAFFKTALPVAAIFVIGSTAQAMLSGHIIATIIPVIAIFALLRREGLDKTGGKIVHDPLLGRRMWIYALPLIPLAIVNWAVSLSDRYIIGDMLGTADVGVYAATYGLISQPFMIVQGIVTRTVTGVYYEAMATGDKARAISIFRASLLITAGICALGFVLVCALKRWVAFLLLAEPFRGGVAMMPWLALGYSFYSIGTIFEMRLYAADRTTRVLVNEIFVSIAGLVGPILLIPRYSVMGAAMACPIYFGLMCVGGAILSHGVEKAGAKLPPPPSDSPVTI